METIDRIRTLNRSGFGPNAIAAILGVDLAELAEANLDPADIPTVGPAVATNGPWHIVGNPGEPNFQNGYFALGTQGDQYALKFRLRADGDVEFQGYADNGDDSVAFTLPVGFRPVGTVEQRYAAAAGGGKLAEVTVFLNGDVWVNKVPAGNQWTNFSSVRFSTA